MKHQPVRQGQTTTLGTSCPTLCEKCMGSLTPPANQYSLSSLSEKTRTSNHLQISLQRQHILLGYFKTLSVGLVWGMNPRPRGGGGGGGLESKKGRGARRLT